MHLFHQALERAPANLAKIPLIVRHQLPTLGRAVDANVSPSKVVVGGAETAIANKRSLGCHPAPPSSDPKVFRRRLAVATVEQLVTDRRAFGEIGQPGLLDRADVNEDILAAVVGLDEAIALRRVEPFDCADSHVVLSKCVSNAE
jgi:hypothetical protein